MSDWKEYKLNEIAVINPTESISKGKLAKKVAMDDLQPFTKKVNSFSIQPYNGGMKFRNGDTIIARITPCLENGKTAYIDFLKDNEIGFGSTEYIVLRERENISDKHFLYYFSISPAFREVAVLSMTGSSGRQRVQTDVVRDHTFLVPPLLEQRAIAGVMNNLDAKIDLLHRQNQTLEAIAETLFRKWFIEKKKSTWKISKIGDVVETVLGGTPSTKVDEYWNGYIPWINSGEVNKFRIITASKYITELGLKRSNTKLMPKGTTVIAITGATLGQVSLLEIDSCANQSVVGIIPNEIVPKEYIYLWTKLKIEEIILNETGGAQPHINKNDVNETEIILPDDSYLKSKTKHLSSLFSRITLNVFQIQNLVKLRDSLLPKMINGEVKVNFD